MSNERQEIKEKISNILNQLYAIYFDLEKNSVNNDNLSTEKLHSNTFIDGTFIDGANHMYNIMKKIISTKGDGYNVSDLFTMFNCALPEEIFDEFSAEAILLIVDKYFGHENKESDENKNNISLLIDDYPDNFIETIYINNVKTDGFFIKNLSRDDEICIKLDKYRYPLISFDDEKMGSILEWTETLITPKSYEYYYFKVPENASGEAFLRISSYNADEYYSIKAINKYGKELVINDKDLVIFNFIDSAGWINKDSLHITTK